MNNYEDPDLRPFCPDCLCLGPVGSGKSLLLKCLQSPSSVDMNTSSCPTVGTTIKTVHASPTDKLTICEIGGGVAPLWAHYYKGVSKIIFVVDASNLCQISAAGVLLYSILSEPCLRNAKLLLVLSKMDASYRQMRNEALLMLQMKRLQFEVTQKITIVQASSFSGEGLDEIKSWLCEK
ncbi:ADP-ribosylation factor-like protein 16 isoform X2 [Cimex lectularius]|uniref:ADP-ribosylation factor-like protein 16 n=1 Tax=Cimex lectularius TaxID=79782 RepID=A0A8I6STM9_CIMLE|nr:ADP-ribosylation factor-like protein 16 isoform X2 [Cimex lectularius]